MWPNLTEKDLIKDWILFAKQNRLANQTPDGNLDYVKDINRDIIVKFLQSKKIPEQVIDTLVSKMKTEINKEEQSKKDENLQKAIKYFNKLKKKSKEIVLNFIELGKNI